MVSNKICLLEWRPHCQAPFRHGHCNITGQNTSNRKDPGTIRPSLWKWLICQFICCAWLNSGAGYGCCPRQKTVHNNMLQTCFAIRTKRPAFFFFFSKVARVSCWSVSTESNPFALEYHLWSAWTSLSFMIDCTLYSKWSYVIALKEFGLNCQC